MANLLSMAVEELFAACLKQDKSSDCRVRIAKVEGGGGAIQITHFPAESGIVRGTDYVINDPPDSDFVEMRQGLEEDHELWEAQGVV